MTLAEKEAAGLSKYAPAKKILQKDNDGNVVAIHCSLKHAAEAVGVTAAAVGNAVRRNGKCKGFYFEHEEPRKKVFKMPEQKLGFSHMAHIPYFG